jgi:hypothetical protein
MIRQEDVPEDVLRQFLLFLPLIMENKYMGATPENGSTKEDRG